MDYEKRFNAILDICDKAMTAMSKAGDSPHAMIMISSMAFLSIGAAMRVSIMEMKDARPAGEAGVNLK